MPLSKKDIIPVESVLEKDDKLKDSQLDKEKQAKKEGKKTTLAQIMND